MSTCHLYVHEANIARRNAMKRVMVHPEVGSGRIHRDAPFFSAKYNDLHKRM